MELNVIIFLQYSLFSSIACLALFYFRHNIRKYTDKSRPIRYFLCSLNCSILLAAADVAFAIREFHVLPIPDWLSSLFEVVYILGSLFSAFFWVLTNEEIKNSPFVSDKRLFALFCLPFAIIVFFVLTNPFHHLVFTIRDGLYTRGIITLASTFAVNIIVFLSGITGLIRSFRKESIVERRQYHVMFFYTVAILAETLLQLILGPSVPYRSLFIMTGFFIAQDQIMKTNIYVDGLSKVSNRIGIERYLLSHIKNRESDFYCALLDLNNFKGINDGFGHVEGDNAIRLFGEAMNRTAEPGILVGRYGGDEFVLAGRFENEEDFLSLVAKLRRNLNDVIKERKPNAAFDFSIGYARLEQDVVGLTDLLQRADEKLYADKKTRRK